MLISASILLYVFGTNIQVSPEPSPPPTPPPTPPPKPPPSNCHSENTRNWGVYNGNIILLPSQTIETVC